MLSPSTMRMKLASSPGPVAGPAQRSSGLRSNGSMRVGPSSWSVWGNAANGTGGVAPDPIGSAALLYSRM
jgi:hypothetical protein